MDSEKHFELFFYHKFTTSKTQSIELNGKAVMSTITRKSFRAAMYPALHNIIL